MSSVPNKPSENPSGIAASGTPDKPVSEAGLAQVAAKAEPAKIAAVDPAAQARLAERRAEKMAEREARIQAQQEARSLAQQQARQTAAGGPVLKSVPTGVAAPAVAAAKLAPVAAAPATVPPSVPTPAKPAPQAAAGVPLPAQTPGPAAPAAKPQPAPDPTAEEVRPTATGARFRGRHRVLVASFVILVLLPIAAAAFYLWERAADQYASTVGFSVRREEVGSAMDLLGGISALSKSSSSDTDILYEFLKSQKLVADLDAKLDLTGIWSKPENDPIYAYDPTGSIEDLVEYWSRMVRISYDSTSGLIEVRVLAFTPEDATLISQAVLDESSEMINSLSTIAREDAISYSRDELATTEERLKAAREAVTVFRTQHQIVDPSADLAAHAGVLGALQGQLTQAQVELDLLESESTQSNDPRVAQVKRRIAVIEARIAAERSKVGISADGAVDDAYAAVVGGYERLAADKEFAERSYMAALASYDAAEAEARRKSRYLAAHILPTTAEMSRFPQRGVLLSVIALFLFLAWAIGALVTYSLRDRR